VISGSRGTSTNVRFTPKADMCSALGHVRFGPEADPLACSLNDRVSPLQEGFWNCQSKHFCRLEIDDEFKLRGLLDSHVCRRPTLQSLQAEPRTLSKRGRTIGAIRQQATSLSKRSRDSSCRQAISYRQIRDAL